MKRSPIPLHFVERAQSFTGDSKRWLGLRCLVVINGYAGSTTGCRNGQFPTGSNLNSYKLCRIWLSR